MTLFFTVDPDRVKMKQHAKRLKAT